MRRLCWLAALCSTASFSNEAPAAQVSFDNSRFRGELGGDAVWRSLVDKATDTELCVANQRILFATARVGDVDRPASQASVAGDRLTIGFAGCDTQLVYRVKSTDDWIAFHLDRVDGERPSRLTLVRVPVAAQGRVGSYLNAAWDQELAVCLRAINLQTDGRPLPRGNYVELTATTQDAPGPKLEGAAAALIVAAPDELPGILHRLSLAFNLPNNANGKPAKDLSLARDSYWFLSFAEKDVDRVIECCQRTGFRQVMLNSGAWCESPGHYTFRKSNYPDEIESLRRTVARLHDRGILVGMHCFASKVSKRDAYVTPVPDRRFLVDMSATLAADVTADATAIRTREDLSQWPGSSACTRKMWEGGVTKHQEVIIDDEIIQFERIGPDGRWDTFLGCRRGAWGTRAAAHQAAAVCRHYGVDGCINGYIIDQETTLLDEATSRLAHIFNTCQFDMVYFDGGEDVDRRRFHHYASRFQAVAMSKFRRRPLVHMGTVLTHNLWHSFTRSGTADTYWNTIRGRILAGGAWDQLPTVRHHIDRSVQRLVRLENDLLPAELGWFGIWPKGEGTDGLQLDEIEYLMAKSLAHNAPISLQTSFAQMERHPLTPGVLEIVRVYERLRRSGSVAAPARERLRQTGKDFVFLPGKTNGSNDPGEFVEVERMTDIAGSRDLRGFIGSRGDDTIATVWHYLGRDGKLHLDLEGVSAFTMSGEVVPATVLNGATVVPVDGRRTTLIMPNIDLATAKHALANARLEVRQPVTLWLPAEGFRKSVGMMATGSAAGETEPGALGDFVLCTGACRPPGGAPNFVEYEVDIPHGGRWTLWARVRYPRGSDDSFGIVRPGEEVTLAAGQALGNCGAAGTKWHWTGRGGGLTSKPPGKAIMFRLDPGPFVFRIHAREGGGTPASNPRLDLLCLTEDPDYVPNDTDAQARGKR